MHLVRAYRSWPRPSSLSGAKASALHPYSPHHKMININTLIGETTDKQIKKQSVSLLSRALRLSKTLRIVLLILILIDRF